MRFSPLNRPGHEEVTSNHRRGPEEDLLPRAAEGVEDGVVESTAESPLAVHGESVRANTLLGGGA